MKSIKINVGNVDMNKLFSRLNRLNRKIKNFSDWGVSAAEEMNKFDGNKYNELLKKNYNNFVTYYFADLFRLFGGVFNSADKIEKILSDLPKAILYSKLINSKKYFGRLLGVIIDIRAYPEIEKAIKDEYPEMFCAIIIPLSHDDDVESAADGSDQAFKSYDQAKNYLDKLLIN